MQADGVAEAQMKWSARRAAPWLWGTSGVKPSQGWIV